MRSTTDIQEEYAKNNKYESFRDLLLDQESEIEWHVSKVQELFAKSVCESEKFKIIGVEDIKGNNILLGNTIKFSDKYKPFDLDKIKINPIERRIELYGEGLFCTLNESDYSILNK